MRYLSLLAIITTASLALAPPPTLAAQGRIITLPCPETRCIPMPCPRGVCRPNSDPTIERKSTDVRIELVSGVLRYEITEVFVNRGGRVGEADYIFPLPKDAAFQDLQLDINGEMVSGEAMDARRARSIYEEIVRRERDPALVEWMGYGLLRARIFPIAPGEEKTVVVRYHAVAEREGDALRIDHFRGTAAGDAGKQTLSLSYRRDAGYGNPYSPTHILGDPSGTSTRTVTVEGNAPSLTILLPTPRRGSAGISMLAHAPGRENGFALITLSPPAIAAASTPRDVTFVVDVSGSMAGKKIEQARAAGMQFLATLRPQDRFRIVSFASDVRAFREEMLPATRANVAAAEQYITTLAASGGTNISGALDEALEPPTMRGRLTVVLFLTDGEATVGERRPDAIAQRAADQRGSRRIFAFGVGADVNAALIERLAMEGQGTPHFVRPEESVERAVSVVASRLSAPVVTDVRLRTDGVRLEQLYPTLPADVFAGQDLVVLARYSGSGNATLRFEGITADGPVTWTQRVTFPARQSDDAFVARLWATRRVGFLSAERRRNGPSTELDDELRTLGERYGIPTELTSYLVLEPGMVAGSFPDTRGKGAMGAIGAATGAAAPPPVVPQAAARQARFEQARTANEMRTTTSLAEADAAGAKSSALRRAGGRTFTLRDSVWTDAGIRGEARVVRLQAFSPAYFALLTAIPELRELLAVGENVKVAGRQVTLHIGPQGAERLTAQELERLQREW
jgi:Ca-activated chloride channel homolog